jgi:hypothetical protein
MSRYPFTSRHVELLGHRIHYVEHGNGPPVLFLHRRRRAFVAEEAG